MHAIPQAPKLPKTTWVDKIRTAVLTLMYMNHRLYKHLYSSTFDVPDYERENILYNNETLYLQYQQYLAVDFTNPDFKFHQRQLDVQILCNRRLRENVRDAREMYADISNSLYKRKKIITAKVFPNAAQLNLPKALPMTYLCDHLLSVYHYMYVGKDSVLQITTNPVIEDVMNYITGEKPSVTPGMSQPVRRARGVAAEINTDGVCTFIDIKPRPNYKPAQFEDFPRQVYLFDLPGPFRDEETSEMSKPIDIGEAFQLEETPEFSKPVEIPGPFQLEETPEFSKPIEIPEPFQLVETPEISKPTESSKSDQIVENPEFSKSIKIPIPVQLAEALTFSKPAEPPKPVQFEEAPQNPKRTETSNQAEKYKPNQREKPTLIGESDVVGQILLQGLDCSKIQLPSHRPKTASSSVVESTSEDKVTAPVRKTDFKTAPASSNPATARDTNGYKAVRETMVQDLTSAVKPTKTVSTVAWDVKKVLVPAAKTGEKRPKNVLSDAGVRKDHREIANADKRQTDILDDNIQEEMAAKRQRMAQWLQDYSSKSSGTKRKASLMDKSRKDHAAKRQKMTKAGPKSAASQPLRVIGKKSGINWIIRW